jgi:hypothetical protein
MLVRSFRVVPLGVGLVLCLGGVAEAQSVQLLGAFKDWSAYSASEGAGAMCFAMSKPTDVAPSPDGYTQGYLYLTHRPAENVNNEINVVAGFDFAPDQPATLTVDGKSFALFTQKDSGWLADATQNDALAGALRAGQTVVIQGTADKGVLVSETFSLAGATAASKAISSC